MAPVVGSDEEVGTCQGTVPATATNSTGNPAAEPGDPATFNVSKTSRSEHYKINIWGGRPVLYLLI